MRRIFNPNALRVIVLSAFVLCPQHLRADEGDDFMTRVSTYKDLASLLQGAVRELADASNQSLAQQVLTDELPAIESQLNWTGENGHLFDIRVEEHINSGVIRIEKGYPRGLGSGRTPTEVLAAAESRSEVFPEASDGFQISKERSFYIWVDKKDGKFEFKRIAYPFSSALERSAIQLSSDRSVLSRSEQFQHDRVYSHVIETLRTDAKKVEVAVRLAKLNQERLQVRAQLGEIHETLNSALQEAARIEAANQRLTRLSKVLSIAAQTQQASAVSHGQIDNKLSTAKDSSEILKALQDYGTEKNTAVTNLQQDENRQALKLEASESTLNSELQNAGVPQKAIPLSPRP